MRMTGRQIDGLMVVVFVTAAVYLLSFLSVRMAHQDVHIAHGDPRDGSILVKLAADSGQGGIYYLSEATTVSALLNIAGIKHQDRFDQSVLGRPLITGDMVSVDLQERLTLNRMTAAERIALGIALDLNRATSDELMLIPGIGEGTALKIVALREASGPFKKVSDLTQISGIKEKRLKQWERYFYLPR
jgi:competence protein ComEA